MPTQEALVAFRLHSSRSKQNLNKVKSSQGNQQNNKDKTQKQDTFEKKNIDLYDKSNKKNVIRYTIN